MLERRFHSRFWLAAGLAAVLVWPHAARGGEDCTFFVRAGFVASGTPDGRHPESAFATITAGAAAVRNPGEVVCVGPGLYVEGNVTLGHDGAPGDGETTFPVVVRADPTGASTDDAPGPVKIVPPDDRLITTGFLLMGRQYVVIDGFDISGFSDAGIQVRATANGVNSANVTLRNNSIHDCAKNGIDVVAQDAIVIEGNTVLGNGEAGISVQMCFEQTPEGLCRGTSGLPVVPMLSNNRSAGNLSHGIFIQNAKGGVLQNNAVYTNDGSGISLRAASDMVVANNLIYDNGFQGLAVGQEDRSSPRPVIFNNTIYANFDWGIEIGSENAASPGAMVVNNIVWRNGDGFKGIGVLNEASGTTPIRPPSVCGYVAGFNVLLDALPDDTPVNPYHFQFDPMFGNPEGPDGVLGGQRMGGTFVDHSADDDFHLRQPGVSPAVDAGSATTAELGLTGSTASDGRADQGTVDIGFHYDASPAQMLTLSAPFMPLYVRKSGNDDLNGRAPSTPLGTIAAGGRRAEGGITVVVGPGKYEECDLFSPGNRGKAAFLADPNGAMTHDRPGPVLVDASRCHFDDVNQVPVPGDTGFDLSNTCDAVIDGFHVTGTKEDGIRVDGHSDGAVIQNNVIFGVIQDNVASGPQRGVHVINSQKVTVRNNLVFATSGGIQLGGRVNALDDATTAGSRDAVIEFNTVFHSEFNGIQVGDGEGISSGATVRYNVTGENKKAGIEIGNDVHLPDNLVGYESGYNLVGDRFGTGVPHGDGDLVLDLAVEPLYVDPTVVDVSGDWLGDRHWRLKQTAAGQSELSEAVDFSDESAEDAGLADRSTRTDGVPDTGLVDRGYHYPYRGAESLTGDCNGDGVVAINELVTAVNIALGNTPMSACPAVDADGNGIPGINELVQAVNNATQG